jgi:hypothetical protein
MEQRSGFLAWRAALAALASAAALSASALAQEEPEVTAAGQVVAESERSRAEAEPEDPTAAGRDLYFRGAGQLKRAEKLAVRAAKASGEEREKLAADSRAAYEAAVESLASAVQANPALRDASVALGTALRALDRAEEAAQVHALALRRDGRDDANFRGYVESLLALHRLGNVTALHDQLRSEEPKRAKLVLEMLRRFRDERAKDPAGLAAADLDRLDAWLAAHAGA